MGSATQMFFNVPEAVGFATTSPGRIRPPSASPTPAGVPVKSTSQSSSVMALDRYSIWSQTPKSNSRVLDAWRCSPLTKHRIARP